MKSFAKCRCQLYLPSAWGGTGNPLKGREARANRKYPDYRNKWENILCANLSCVRVMCHECHQGRAGDNMLHHGYHHQVTNMGDRIEIWETKGKNLCILSPKVLSGNNRSSVLVLARWQLVCVSGGDREPCHIISLSDNHTQGQLSS